MLFSFIYLVFVSLLKLLLGSRRRAQFLRASRVRGRFAHDAPQLRGSVAALSRGRRSPSGGR